MHACMSVPPLRYRTAVFIIITAKQTNLDKATEATYNKEDCLDFIMPSYYLVMHTMYVPSFDDTLYTKDIQII